MHKYIVNIIRMLYQYTVNTMTGFFAVIIGTLSIILL